MQMEAVKSSLISHRGYDPEKQILNIRFASKKFIYGSLYSYGNVPPALYAEACAHVNPATGELSFGQFFQQQIKPNDRQYPFRKLEDPHNGEGFLDVADTIDFSSQQPLPVAEPAAEVLPPLPEDEQKLLAEAEALAAKTTEIGKLQGNMILIASPEAARLAMTTGMAIARMRDALEKTMRPKITELYAPYKAALAILNRYDKPLEEDQNRLRLGLAAYNREQQRIAQEEEARLRREQVVAAEAEAKKKAEELQIHDAETAAARGETELADQIISAPALPVAPIYQAPIRVQSAMPRQAGASIKEKWTFEITDEIKIPDEYWIVDTKAIEAVVGKMKGRSNTLIPGIRAYDAGTVAFSKRG